jgi:hypothetical protein
MLVLRKRGEIADIYNFAPVRASTSMRRSDVQKISNLHKPKTADAIFKGNPPLQRARHVHDRLNTPHKGSNRFASGRVADGSSVSVVRRCCPSTTSALEDSADFIITGDDGRTALAVTCAYACECGKEKCAPQYSNWLGVADGFGREATCPGFPGLLGHIDHLVTARLISHRRHQTCRSVLTALFPDCRPPRASSNSG